MIDQRTSGLLERVSVLRSGLDMDVIRIRQSNHGRRVYAQPVRDLGMRLRDLGQELMDQADRLDGPLSLPPLEPIPEVDQ